MAQSNAVMLIMQSKRSPRLYIAALPCKKAIARYQQPVSSAVLHALDAGSTLKKFRRLPHRIRNGRDKRQSICGHIISYRKHFEFRSSSAENVKIVSLSDTSIVGTVLSPMGQCFSSFGPKQRFSNSTHASAASRRLTSCF